ncbi:4'-phosphopantetheinyl transferase superfamily protein [Crocinitomicaceae bacterium CZZ-1]|uniref:4'-phosphopantetheinyl transferase superfamily protein n=1 Tax=Taishania pollutisoli TaxID=2766479 RepID=A0A8J6TWQ8_9FLAO|nr:4'-phosphopantetheinyl transferase superfamily protein [Taishania pollutisoli]MBC9811336.1 4'-phosphopantetheinyl transferase superfamily protein [Taishania pollutisoli]MBX2947749.1 4'-phosphopantetheinyl transferase superfamily protein [Crocinitomicaceae bacterium]NGF75118.1 4'-phosphopantetheinyl transferase superfamily protein [Fluviicola sp. SGL-29]
MFTLENVAIGGSIVYIIKYNHFPIEDFFQILHPVEQVRLQTFASEKRRTEYIATRILKDTIFPGALIDYNKEGAPFIEHAPHLSVSHCKGASAIAVCPDHIVGLDIEPMSNKAQRLHSKFINPEEAGFLNTEDVVEMTRAWSCKESLLKLAGRKGLIFKKDLLIESVPGNDQFLCSIHTNSGKKYVNLTSKVVDNMIITINHTDLYSR